MNNRRYPRGPIQVSPSTPTPPTSSNDEVVWMSTKTAAKYIDTQRGLELFTVDWWKRPASDISRADVQRLMNEMETKGYSRSRRRSVKAYISVCWAWGLDSGGGVPGRSAFWTQGVLKGNRKSRGYYGFAYRAGLQAPVIL